MTTLHMKTEQIRELASQLNWCASNFSYKASSLFNVRNRLFDAWQGGGSNDFYAELNSWIIKYERKVDELQYLALRVSREVDEWETADNNNSFGEYLGISGVFTGSPVGWVDGYYDSPKSSFDWWDSSSAVVSSGTDLWLEYAKRSDYKQLGRYLNWLEDNKRAGWVGRMDNLGKFLDSHAGVRDFGIPLGFSFVSGLAEGEGVAKAGTSGIIESGIGWGLTLIPGVGTVMAVSSGIQYIGNTAAITLEAMGDHEGAVLLQNGLEAVDLGGYVGDFSDAVADMVLPPYNDPPDFSAISDRAEKILDLGNFITR